MNRFFGKIRTASHLTLFVGVLIGVLFSSGEGIRLLPFPQVVSGVSENKADLIDSSRPQSYAHTVKNAAAPSVTAKSKSKFENRFSGLADIELAGFRPHALSAAQCPHNYAQNDSFTAHGFLSTPSDRGPPA